MASHAFSDDRYGLDKSQDCYRPINYVTGRPTDYHPSYCVDVIDYGKRGKSRAWIAAELGTTRMTLWNWEQRYPEFLYAMQISRELSQQWWEDVGEHGMTNGPFNATVWTRSMSARFPDDWRETKVLAGDPQAPLIPRTIDPRRLDPDQREMLKQLLLAASAPEVDGEFTEAED